jgi:hypothetical protein
VPHLSGQIGPWGPLIFVNVGVSAPRSAALLAAGQGPPAPVVAKLIVDTGASLTSIDCTILAQLALTSKGKVPIHTPSTQGVPHQADQFDVSLTIFGAPNAPPVYVNSAMPVVEGQFKVQGIDGLLGRDVLAVARMTYGGPDSWYGISF